MLCVLPLVCTVACSDRQPNSSRKTSSDEDAIPVVHSSGNGSWAAGEAWTVKEVCSAGAGDGQISQVFGLISGVDVDADGNVYIADATAPAVFVFDASGKLLRTIGRAGHGPGEFGGNLAGVFVVGSELLTPDLPQTRISRFTLHGEFVSSFRFDLTKGMPVRWDMSEGRLIAQRRLPLPPDSTQILGDPIVTIMEPADTLARLPVGQSVQITGGIPIFRQFKPEPLWDASSDGRQVVGMSDAWRFTTYDASGRAIRVISRSVSPERVTERDRQAVKDALTTLYKLQGAPPELARRVIASMEFADDLPTVVAVALGPEGSLWVQPLRSAEERERLGFTVFPKDLGSRTWGVFDSSGVYMVAVSFPIDFQPTRSLDDRIYGIARDELDVPLVKGYRVIKK